MKQGIYTISENTRLAEGIYRMVLSGDSSACTAPGQFINIKLDGFYLRRPISVCDWDESSITIIYKVLGRGTEMMTSLPLGTELDVLTGLGNGYDLSKSGDKPLLIGGGVGIPPLYNACRQLIAQGKKPTVILGFNSSADMFYVDEFAALGADVLISSADGSVGVKGFVTDVMKDLDYTYFYTCGPTAMLKAIDAIAKTSGELSFEERMGCGFGACMGCSCKTKYGNKRICKDGPVLVREEIVW
ncbi:MAG: dihydroorotate dehydrogenase electron transfer subunit [Ruminococcaceae bacterium]|nr:dihydroorotate dehydrogenase electron transfer subunit [Oscillospiraceae bacterium]